MRNVVNQKVAASFLQKLGYRPEVVSNGREAIQCLERQPYDVVLLDVPMPEMDGYEAAREIRRRRNESDRPRIIAMTGNAAHGIGRSALLQAWTTTLRSRYESKNYKTSWNAGGATHLA